MESVRSNSPAGHLLERVLDLRFDLKNSIPVPPINAEEELALKILDDETRRFEKEEVDKRQEEMEQERRGAEFQRRRKEQGGR
jgi:hypothetical protein